MGEYLKPVDVKPACRGAGAKEHKPQTVLGQEVTAARKVRTAAGLGGFAYFAIYHWMAIASEGGDSWVDSTALAHDRN